MGGEILREQRVGLRAGDGFLRVPHVFVAPVTPGEHAAPWAQPDIPAGSQVWPFPFTGCVPSVAVSVVPARPKVSVGVAEIFGT